MDEYKILIKEHYNVVSKKNVGYSTRNSKESVRDRWKKVYKLLGEEEAIQQISSIIDRVKMGIKL